MKKKERRLKYVLLRQEELKENGSYVPGARELLEDLERCQIQILRPEEAWEKPPRDCLLLSARTETLRQAGERGIAAAAFEHGRYPEIPSGVSDVILLGLEELDASYLLRIWQRKQGIPWRILETKRCYVRELTLEDLEDLFALYAQKGMTDYIEPLYEREEEEAYQRAYIQNMYGFYGYGMWLVKEKGTDRLIGRAGLENRELNGSFELELGYAFAPAYQHQGYALEVCRGILSYAWEKLEYDRINCLIEPENEASIRLAERLGGIREGQVILEGNSYERYVIYREKTEGQDAVIF